MNNYERSIQESLRISRPPDPAIIAGDRQAAVMRGLMSADATFVALQHSVQQLTKSAPKDHDILIQAFGIAVTNVRYVQPHTFVFEGHNSEGHATFAVCHYSQLVAHVVYVPPRQPERSRVITGFSNAPVA
jgi:hypothetical protein